MDIMVVALPMERKGRYRVVGKFIKQVATTVVFLAIGFAISWEAALFFGAGYFMFLFLLIIGVLTMNNEEATKLIQSIVDIQDWKDGANCK